jgi:DNA replication protein DnaC
MGKSILSVEKQDEQLRTMIEYLGLKNLQEKWQSLLDEANRSKPAYRQFLQDLLVQETQDKKERQRLSRLVRAHIPEMRVLETFPFDRQPNLKKKFVLDLYDTLEFMRKPQSLIYIGPTGCGKTGLATSFLVHAINQGHRGLWMDFKVLLDTLWSSIADHSEKQIVKRFAEVDCLVIDELGHIPIKKEQAGLFFDLMKRRHGNKTTLITTQLGYDEWADFLQNKHLTAAMLDRMTENCTVFNMKKCISIRPKNVQYATNSTEDEN